MDNLKVNPTTMPIVKKRRLSLWRLLFALIMSAGLSYSSLWGWNRFEDIKEVSENKPWFAPYVDVTATPFFPFEQLSITPTQHDLVLSFVVSHESDPCSPSWGRVYTLDEASEVIDLDRRIARFRQRGGNVIVSFGGQLNNELAIYCSDTEKLKEAYEEVINRYQIDTIDLDIEGEALKNRETTKRRAEVLARLQKDRRNENKKLAVWLTLPVSPQGLTEDGTNAVSDMLSSGVDLAGVNIMVMDYGASKEKTQTMQQAGERALIETHRQLGILFNKAGIFLNDVSLWSKIGATPMIGQNDIAGEIFTLPDAVGFNEFSVINHIGRMSMWSINRDIECGENYVKTNIVSDSCSGVKQEKFAFSGKLSAGFDGDSSANASTETVPDQETEQKLDNPDESPYQIWTEVGVYLEGTKVVWHQNVYQAKWWTTGDIPDNPVLQSWETPWQLIGPVLPGEKPIPQLELPEGTFPNWSGAKTYDTGDQILFDNIPYKAKWWTQGDSPAASSSNPDSSPWSPLTRDQINEILDSLGVKKPQEISTSSATIIKL